MSSVDLERFEQVVDNFGSQLHFGEIGKKMEQNQSSAAASRINCCRDLAGEKHTSPCCARESTSKSAASFQLQLPELGLDIAAQTITTSFYQTVVLTLTTVLVT